MRFKRGEQIETEVGFNLVIGHTFIFWDKQIIIQNEIWKVLEKYIIRHL